MGKLHSRLIYGAACATTRRRKRRVRGNRSRAATSGWSGNVLYGDVSGPGTLQLGCRNARQALATPSSYPQFGSFHRKRPLAALHEERQAKASLPERRFQLRRRSRRGVPPLKAPRCHWAKPLHSQRFWLLFAAPRIVRIPLDSRDAGSLVCRRREPRLRARLGRGCGHEGRCRGGREDGRRDRGQPRRACVEMHDSSSPKPAQGTRPAAPTRARRAHEGSA
jgi:hypothetical protein